MHESLEDLLKRKDPEEFKEQAKQFEVLVGKKLGINNQNFAPYKIAASILGKRLFCVINNWDGTNVSVYPLDKYKFCAYGFIGDSEKDEPQPIILPLNIKNNNLNTIFNSKPSDYNFSGTFLIGKVNGQPSIVRYTGGGGPHNRNYYIYVADEHNQFTVNIDSFNLAVYGIKDPTYHSLITKFINQ